MSYFIIRPCIIDQHGITPVFPDQNHKRPDFIAYPGKSSKKTPPFVDDDMPSRPFVEDAAAISEALFSNFLSRSQMRSSIIDGQICLDPTDVIHALWQQISLLELPNQETENYTLRSIVQVVTEGRFVGATHVCAHSPADVGDSHAIH